MKQYRERCFTKIVIAIVMLVSCVFPDISIAQTLIDNDTTSVSAIVVDPNVTPPQPPRNGGGGSRRNVKPNTVLEQGTSITFSGMAYPSATVTATQIYGNSIQTTANKDGYFFIMLPAIASPSSSIILEAIDTRGVKSEILVYTLSIPDKYITVLEGIAFPPTIQTNGTLVQTKDTLIVSGFAQPGATVTSSVQSLQAATSISSVANALGAYTFSIPLSSLSPGQYTTYTKSSNVPRSSNTIPFVLQQSTYVKKSGTPPFSTAKVKGDCNFDKKVNMVDFSIFSYWYKKVGFPSCIDLNNDKQIDMVDGSILAYYWDKNELYNESQNAF